MRRLTERLRNMQEEELLGVVKTLLFLPMSAWAVYTYVSPLDPVERAPLSAAVAATALTFRILPGAGKWNDLADDYFGYLSIAATLSAAQNWMLSTDIPTPHIRFAAAMITVGTSVLYFTMGMRLFRR